MPSKNPEVLKRWQRRNKKHLNAYLSIYRRQRREGNVTLCENDCFALAAACKAGNLKEVQAILETTGVMDAEKMAFYDRKVNERVRLDRHLVWLVNDIANMIAKDADAGMSVKVKGVGVLKVEEWTSYIETRKVLVYGDPKDDPDLEPTDNRFKGAAFGFDVMPGDRFFWHGQLGEQGVAATRNNYLSFSLKIPEIVTAFSAKQDEIIDRLLRSFTELRHLVGST